MLNLQEIFVWYFEQKGVDNPERFLGVNDGVGVNNATNPLINSMLQGVNEGAGVNGEENGNNPLLNSMQQVVAGAATPQETAQDENANPSQEKAQPENPIEQAKTDFNAEAISKLIPIFAKYIRNAKKSKQNSFESMLSQVLQK